MRTLTISRITIMDGRRIATVYDGRTRHTHALGPVGEDITPYLGHRTGGYAVALPADLRDVDVMHVDTQAAPNVSGKYPMRAVPLSSLGAVDITDMQNRAARERASTIAGAA